ncbi:hypothetical protein DSM106972_073710 [Dulcicalothrix desertica PCC 7102]|uniref:GTP cyclohydrolase I domain-containing protein n=1 Tax=Dulcicalothrix desertica PCC 7102 TaxID=232991 RepID=A0A3S1CC51_9CYAN|nr:hypothetical protein DSM106972_073710 [Dulcicalothrix desertica PCC 7102]
MRDTPKRVVKALQFLTKGYNESLDELLNGAVFSEDANEMVLVRDIDILSFVRTSYTTYHWTRACGVHSQW